MLSQQTFTCSKSTKCEIRSKLTIKTPQCQRSCSGIFNVNFELISHLFLVFLLLHVNRQTLAWLPFKIYGSLTISPRT